eukprot:m.147719 g.147719  ORF g.147719 m.147719 type:complete len:220 (-) comp14990_c0_seq6:214-873(-)
MAKKARQVKRIEVDPVTHAVVNVTVFESVKKCVHKNGNSIPPQTVISRINKKKLYVDDGISYLWEYQDPDDWLRAPTAQDNEAIAKARSKLQSSKSTLEALEKEIKVTEVLSILNCEMFGESNTQQEAVAKARSKLKRLDGDLESAEKEIKTKQEALPDAFQCLESNLEKEAHIAQADPQDKKRKGNTSKGGQEKKSRKAAAAKDVTPANKNATIKNVK